MPCIIHCRYKKKNVALQAGVLQQADMRPVYREVQKCRAENCGPYTQHSAADYFTLTPRQSVKTDQRYIYILMYTIIIDLAQVKVYVKWQL